MSDKERKKNNQSFTIPTVNNPLLDFRKPAFPSWHTGGIHFDIFTLYKNKIRNSIKERGSANGISVSVATAASVWLAIGSATHTGTPVIGWRRAEASLPPWQHCFLIAHRRWKGGREGRRLSLRRHLCIIHPLSPECASVCAPMREPACVCNLGSAPLIGGDVTGDTRWSRCNNCTRRCNATGNAASKFVR